MQLNIKQRFAVVGIYILLIISIGRYFSNDWVFIFDTNNNLNLLLIATGLALILSTYITEPYFTKPVDVITRWVAIFLFLLGLNSKQCISLYDYWIYTSLFFIGISLLAILLHGFNLFQKQQRIVVDIICKISRPEFVFSILYFDIVTSLFLQKPKEYPILIGFGFLLLIDKPIVWIVKWLSRLLKFASTKNNSSVLLGEIIGFDNENLYKVEILNSNAIISKKLSGQLVYFEKNNVGIVGIILKENTLLNKKWIEILNLKDENNKSISFSLSSLKPLTNEKTIFSLSNEVYMLEIKSFSEEFQLSISSNPIFSNFGNFVGYVWQGSTINRIKFLKLFDNKLLSEEKVGEGTIIKTNIGNEEVLFQIIDAKTEEEILEQKNTNGFIIGTAQKLGKYDAAEYELNTVKWLPEIYSPIFLLEKSEVKYDHNISIGKLPNTNFGINIKNPSELVTHNTAILGILGIGKSCLTFELIKKIINETEVKIFCYDLTNQYAKELPKYIDSVLIQNEMSTASITKLKTENKDGITTTPSTWGNEHLYKSTLASEIENFIQSEKRILILNPDLHNVSKPGSQFNITHKIDLSPAEKVRIISERLIIKAASLGETNDARYLLVFEEAHSLVPEWNSISNEGDKSATNGTAKVILQGRKYGLGSFVITQRTANISKSILNQCNTIFSLRIFDDTGKQFLENYIGSDYSNLLATLEERHCVAIGKALKLKQPIILELNDMNDIIIKNEE
jgi:hypothetical protein